MNKKFNTFTKNLNTKLKNISNLFLINIHSFIFLTGIFFINVSSFIFNNILGFLTIGISLLIIALLINKN
jgi:hypothetical protein